MLPTYLKFKLNYNSEKLQQELNYCLEQEWPMHFNTMDFEGVWKSISLRSMSGSATDIFAHPSSSGYQDTSLLSKTPYIKEILDSWQCDKEVVRLLALAPGSQIKPHKDQGCSYQNGSFRIHIPIVTNPQVRFTINDEQLYLQEGECWYMDFGHTHSIVNEGKTTRVHLIIDAIRNDWTDQLFEQQGYDIAAVNTSPQYDDDTISKMIAQLELMNTPTAAAIILNLRKQQLQGK